MIHRIERPAALLTVVLCLVLCIQDVRAEFVEYDDSGWSNETLSAAYLGIGTSYLGAAILGLVPEPTVSIPAEAAQYMFEVSLKGLPPIFDPPEPLPGPVMPNTDDGCSFKFVMPLASAGFSNVLGFFNTREHVRGGFTWRGKQAVADVDIGEVERIQACLENDGGQSSALRLRSKCDLPSNNWGVIGYPRIFHLFSDARATLTSFTGGIQGLDRPQVIDMPAGFHQLDWTATTEMNLISDVLVPPLLMAVMAYTESRIGKMGSRLDELKARNSAGRVRFLDEADIKASEIADLQKNLARWKWFNDWILGQKELNVRGTNIRDYLGVLGLDTPIQDLSIDAAAGLLLEPVVTAIRFDSSNMQVYDLFPPEVALSRSVFPLEATDFGGVRFARVDNTLRSAVSARDECGRDFQLRMSAIDPDTGDEIPVPVVLPLDETVQIRWSVTDLGPNLSPGEDPAYPEVERTADGRYTRSVVQTITVADTQSPLLLAPPSRVIETESEPPEDGLYLSGEELGNALTIDLADPEPVIGNDSPGFFPTGSRTTVTWTSTDSSGNRAADTQLITVKEQGTNTTPDAFPASATTLTAMPVNVTLRGSDPDFLDGRFDPLTFRIRRQPAYGEFIAPLYPFFINDYRSIRPPPEGQDDGGFYQSVLNSGVSGWLNTQVCENDSLTEAEKRDQEEQLARLVIQPLYVHVMDDGTRFILDSVLVCGSSTDEVIEYQRISKWDGDENYLGEYRLGPDERTHDSLFTIGSDGKVYFTLKEPTGSSTEFRLWRCPTQFEDPDNFRDCETVAYIENSTFPDARLDNEQLSSAVHDPDTGLTFVNDTNNIGILAEGGQMLGTLPEVPDPSGEFLNRDPQCYHPDTPVEGPSNIWEIGFSMTLDEAGNLYVADSCVSRIHKFSRSYIDDNGDLVFGTYIGWMGKCLRSTNKACDEDLQRSKGFSCTDETCFLNQCLEQDCVTTTPDEAPWGDRAGQFDLPLYVTFDPNGLLYVADYFNLRVQRFGVDGTFAGEAQSNENGVVDPEKPSFVLGNMPAPRALAVNSTQFFVTDQREQFVHVFGTLPFKDLTDDSAVVTYVSRQDFHSAEDSFEFSVDDGLAESDPATVTIRVDRNFRAPEAISTTVETMEDQALEFRLEADDPDGIAGEDFNGLDTLTWEIVKGPQNGTLTYLDKGWVRYEPESDFFGGDLVRFRVNDGRFDSKAANVTIRVIKQNDPPVVKFVDRRVQVGLGLAVVYKGSFTDDTNFEHSARIDWGDGVLEGQGEILVDEDAGTAEVENVVLYEPTFSGEGQTIASHTYEMEGAYTIELCVQDADGLEGCETHEIEVLPLAELTMGVTVDNNQASDGVPFPYVIEVAAADPTVGAGLTARDVELNARIDDLFTLMELNVISIGQAPAPAARAPLAAGDTSPSVTAVPGARCSVDGQTFRCTIDALEPGEVARIEAVVVSEGKLIFNDFADFIADLAVNTPSTTPLVQSFLDIDLLADPTDTDGDGMSDAFEIAFGLDPASDDADGDRDRDGLSNLREFEESTDPTSRDTDSDGLSDLQEVELYRTYPNNEDTDGDGMPDGWEIDNDLDPFVDDAARDEDGDHFTNLEEYRAGTDPRDARDNPALNIPVNFIPGLAALVLLMLGMAYLPLRSHRRIARQRRQASVF